MDRNESFFAYLKAQGFTDEQIKKTLELASQCLAETREKPDFSTIEDGDHFLYCGIEFVRLGKEQGGILCVTAQSWKDEIPFDEENSNNWAKSTLRDVLHKEFFPLLDARNLKPISCDLIADNGDDRYGETNDAVGILSCDQIRKYRRFLPHYDTWVWTCTPWYINDSGYGIIVRYLGPAGGLGSSLAYDSYGVAPACVFIE